MTFSAEKVAAARRASGLTIEKAAAVCAMSKPSYIKREKDPGQFRMHEIVGLYQALTDTARPILHSAIEEALSLDGGGS